MPKIALVSDGQVWTGIQALSIRKSMDQANHTFSMTTTDRFAEGIERWNVRGGSEVQIMIDGQKAFDGFVQKYRPRIGPASHTVSIEGASRVIDIVESSHVGTVFWKNVQPEAIIAEVLQPFGIEAMIEEPMRRIGNAGFRVGVGESPFSIVRKLAEKNSLTAYTDSNNVLILSRTPSRTQFSSILQGDYISLDVEHDLSQSYSEVIVKAQQNSTSRNFAQEQRIDRRFKNPAQTRHRPFVIVANGTDEDQQDFVQYACRRFSGNVLSANVTVKDARTRDGSLWAINETVFVDAPIADVKQELLVSEVEFNISEGQGFQTNLKLRLAETYSYVAPNSDQTLTPDNMRSRREARRSAGPFNDLLRSFTA